MVPVIVGILVLLLVVLSVYTVRLRARKFEENRKRLFEQFAVNQGAQFSKIDIFGLQEKTSHLAAISVAGNQLNNIVHMRTSQGSLYLFDKTNSAGSHLGVISVCLAESQRSFGADVIINEAESEQAAKTTRDMGGIIPGMEFLTFNDKPFDNRFLVTCEHEKSVKNLLNGEMRSFLVNNASMLSDQLVIQIQDNLIAVCNSGSSSKSIETEGDLQILVEITMGFLASKTNLLS